MKTALEYMQVLPGGSLDGAKAKDWDELIRNVRREFAKEVSKKLLDAARPLHRSSSTFDGCEAAGLDRARRIIESLASPAQEQP